AAPLRRRHRVQPRRASHAHRVPQAAGEDMTSDSSTGENATIVFIGRLDAAQCARAQAHIDSALDRTEFDFSELEYISSAGLGLLLKVQKRLLLNGQRLGGGHGSR